MYSLNKSFSVSIGFKGAMYSSSWMITFFSIKTVESFSFLFQTRKMNSKSYHIFLILPFSLRYSSTTSIGHPSSFHSGLIVSATTSEEYTRISFLFSISSILCSSTPQYHLPKVTTMNSERELACFLDCIILYISHEHTPKVSKTTLGVRTQNTPLQVQVGSFDMQLEVMCS